ncbi:NRDE family protein [Humisphaera borealis]|uniref:NRDE family protein n=1 Tax=Humisphaera borealis TaxID=2807512 RepID=A0A7M2WVG9_9BACT|nr:NRDE family protein [Humisphaera borealis]QOV89547.1 NRDE family protein [Humisphaera borealis]
MTLLRLSFGYRMVCNRDEARGRAPAIGPAVFTAGARQAVWPVDPVGGGTWAGMNDAGLAAALLNANPPTPHNPPIAANGAPSRGSILPLLLQSGTIEEATSRLQRFDPAPFAPFQLLITDGRRTIRADWRRSGWQPMLAPLGDAPILLTSSGLGDELVAGPRAELLRSFFGGNAATLDDRERVRLQDSYHSHAWPTSTHTSVLMSRADARTVSRTSIVIDEARAEMTYQPFDGQGDAGAVERVALPRTSVARASLACRAEPKLLATANV